MWGSHSNQEHNDGRCGISVVLISTLPLWTSSPNNLLSSLQKIFASQWQKTFKQRCQLWLLLGMNAVVMNIKQAWEDFADWLMLAFMFFSMDHDRLSELPCFLSSWRNADFNLTCQCPFPFCTYSFHFPSSLAVANSILPHPKQHCFMKAQWIW